MDSADTEPTAPTEPGAGRLALLAVVAAGLLARGALLARALVTSGLDDPDNYLPLARSLASGRGFALDGRLTAYRPPLYPVVLAPVVAALGERAGIGVAVLHLAFGAGAVVLTWATARRWGLGPGPALGAAAVVALDPVLVAQSRSVMTETLAALLAAASLAAVAGPGLRGAALGGLAFGLGTLCRPAALPAALLTATAAVWGGPGRLRERLRRGLALGAVLGATLAPWVVRNLFAVGAPVWATTHGGYTLFLANNPVYYREVVDGPPGAVWSGHNQWVWWDSVNRANRGLSEPKADRAMRDAALRFMATRPADTARASAARLGRFWGLAPAGAVYPGWLRLATAAWTAPLWVALAAGLADRRSWAWPRVAAPLTLLSLSLVHTFYWTDLRMRAPAVPAIALLAAAGADRARKRAAFFGRKALERKR